MRIKSLLFLCLWLQVSVAKSQDSTLLQRPSLKYYNTLAAGVLSSGFDEEITGSLATVHGIAMHKWRLGIGIGIEGYEGWRTIPLFGSLSFDFGRIRNNTFYLQANAGYSFGYYQEEKIEGMANEEDNGGLMLNPMIGYRVGVKKLNVFIAAGYKHQRVDYSYDWIWGWPMNTELTKEFNRFIFQIGFGFHYSCH